MASTPDHAIVTEPEKKVYSTHKVQRAEFIVDAVLVSNLAVIAACGRHCVPD